MPRKEIQPAVIPSPTNFVLNNRISNMGASDLNSHQMNKESEPKNKIDPNMTEEEYQPNWWPFPTNIKNKKSDMPDNTAPAQSKENLSWLFTVIPKFVPFRMIIVAIIASRPAGMLIQKIDFQPHKLTNTPPSAGPIIEPNPTTLKLDPKAFPRSSSVKADRIIATAFPWSMAEPIPCPNLAIRSVGKFDHQGDPATAADSMKIENPTK